MTCSFWGKMEPPKLSAHPSNLQISSKFDEMDETGKKQVQLLKRCRDAVVVFFCVDYCISTWLVFEEGLLWAVFKRSGIS